MQNSAIRKQCVLCLILGNLLRRSDRMKIGWHNAVSASKRPVEEEQVVEAGGTCVDISVRRTAQQLSRPLQSQEQDKIEKRRLPLLE